jgi:hypothetical protein
MCLKGDDIVAFRTQSKNVCQLCQQEIDRSRKSFKLRDYRDSRERIFGKTRDMINAGASEQDVIDSIENEYKALDDAYNISPIKKHGVIIDYPFHVRQRTVQQSLSNPYVLERATVCPAMEI